MEGFIREYPAKNKQLVVTHISEILKAVSLHSISDLSQLMGAPGASLKQIPHIKFSFCKKPEGGNTKNRSFSNIKFEDVARCLKTHLEFNHKGLNQDTKVCRMLFQLCSGLRISNCFDLETNSRLSEKKCKTAYY